MHTGQEPVYGISIDPPSAHDRDDALWARPDGNGYILRISIANVAAAVPKHSDIDRAAYEQARTWYGPDTRHMLPPRLVRSASLLADKKRRVLSLLVRIDANGGISSMKVSSTSLRCAAALSYLEADAILNDPDDPLHSTLFALDRVAGIIRASRKAAGVFLPEDDPAWQAPFSTLRSCRIVEECMVFANRTFAGMLASAQIPALYRSIIETDQGLRARYGPTPRLHSQLAVQQYIHATSPIRRYADIVNQRQILASVRRNPLPYSSDEIANIAEDLNRHEAVDPIEAWEDGPFSRMSDRRFARFASVACRQGIGDEILEEARIRLDAGCLHEVAQAAILGEATLRGSTAADLRRRILRAVASKPRSTMTLLALVCQYIGLDPVRFTTEAVGDGTMRSSASVHMPTGEFIGTHLHAYTRNARVGAGQKVLSQIVHAHANVH